MSVNIHTWAVGLIHTDSPYFKQDRSEKPWLPFNWNELSLAATEIDDLKFVLHRDSIQHHSFLKDLESVSWLTELEKNHCRVGYRQQPPLIFLRDCALISLRLVENRRRSTRITFSASSSPNISSLFWVASIWASTRRACDCNVLFITVLTRPSNQLCRLCTENNVSNMCGLGFFDSKNLALEL